MSVKEGSLGVRGPGNRQEEKMKGTCRCSQHIYSQSL